MAVTPRRLGLTRDQFASFLQDFEQIKQFENLFATVDTINNVTLDDINISAGNANATANEANDSIQRLLDALDRQPSDQSPELLAAINELRQELQTMPRNELGTMAPLQQSDIPWLTFNNAPTPVPTAVGSVYWDGGTTLNVQATSDVLMRVGEAEYTYIKASAAITKGQLCYHTGSVGSAGVINAAPTPLALADPNQIVGIAAENIALNGFGLIQVSGVLRGFNTTGSNVGETWADGDPLYYNPAYVGRMTKVKPSAPNQKTYIGEVVDASPGAAGSVIIRLSPGSTLGGTDSNVQFGALANNDLIQYDSTAQYWKNVPASSIAIGTATALSGGAANRIAYQTAPNTTGFIVAPTSANTYLEWSGSAFQWSSNPLGTVTSVSGAGTVNGLTLTGTVTSSGSLTLGGTLSGISNSALTNSSITINGSAISLGGSVSVGTVTSASVVTANGFAGTIANATTTPAITLSTSVTGLVKGNGTALSAAVAATDYVAPSAYASANGLTMATSRLLGRTTAGTGAAEEISVAGGLTLSGGVLTGASGTVTSVTGTAPVVSSGGSTPAISMAAATASVNGYLTSTDWTTFNSKGSGSVTSVGQTFTGGLISVAGSPITTSGTLALTVAGTSGGIPYFSSGTTWATSAALAANALMVGGGAGVAPATVTTGTGVVTALGVNVGTAGSFIVNGGALGTPSSGTVTNLTGTASININGTVGATTPTTGAFTSVNYTTTLTGGTGIVNLGTGQFYKDASGNVGIGTATPGYKLEVAGNTYLNGVIRAAASSSAAAPGYTFAGDPDTGIYRSAANTLGISTNGLLAVLIDGNNNVGIGAAANASAILDVQSTTKGFRLPNMTTAQKNAIATPAAGLMVFDTTLAKACVYSGAAWQTITSV